MDINFFIIEIRGGLNFLIVLLNTEIVYIFFTYKTYK